jgi:shikimate dehydrogenase
MNYPDLLDNQLNLESEQPFAAILGANPSQGARSPLLWNGAFAAFGSASKMLAMDVSSKNLAPLLSALNNDRRFIGGAVAVPHKESVAHWLNGQAGCSLTPEAANIGAVNAIFRSENGQLCGTNTDGEGALSSLLSIYPNLSAANILLLGPGGAGKAVAAYLAKPCQINGRLTISARSPEKIATFAQKIGSSLISWPPSAEQLAAADILVNCTPVGSRPDMQGIPLADGNASLRPMKKSAIVFDIIYAPASTPLLQLAEEMGLGTLNGAGMNLEQAVIAFAHATANTDKISAIRQAMVAAVQGD